MKHTEKLMQQKSLHFTHSEHHHQNLASRQFKKSCEITTDI